MRDYVLALNIYLLLRLFVLKGFPFTYSEFEDCTTEGSIMLLQVFFLASNTGFLEVLKNN